MSTGDVELDLARRIEALGGSDWAMSGAHRRLWAGPEVPADGVVGESAAFVQLSASRPLMHNDGDLRLFDVQVLLRFSRAAGATPSPREQARARIFALYDVVHRSGAFTGGASSGTYNDIRALGVPLYVPDRYWSLNLQVFRDG